MKRTIAKAADTAGGEALQARPVSPVHARLEGFDLLDGAAGVLLDGLPGMLSCIHVRSLQYPREVPMQKRNLELAMAIAMIGLLPVGAQAVNPDKAGDDSWLRISGTVTKVNSETFQLDCGSDSAIRVRSRTCPR